MKRIAVKKVRDLKVPARRLLEQMLGRHLKQAEEVTVLVSPSSEAAENANGVFCYEVARRERLIGIVKNAPPDLSTNKKHFSGFGCP